MKLFLSFIKLHYKSFLMFAAFSAVFAVVSYLYDMPLEPALYAILLCIVLGSILFVVSFLHFREKHNILLGLRNSTGISIDRLPEPSNIREEDYTELIKLLFDEKRRAESDKARTVSDMTDYYTLWAHQIKTPIAAMRLLIQSGEADNEELAEQLFRIEEYVGMVLTYLRCDSKSNDYVIRQCDVDCVIKEALHKYAKQFIRRKIQLDYKRVGLLTVTDEKWLLFVIEQIISNALKYTREGSISIYRRGADELVIEDTGIGIAPEDLPRVCEKGYTGYNGRSDKKSTGIGLYLCKKILDGLSHTLTIESRESVGTRVTIHLGTINTIYE